MNPDDVRKSILGTEIAYIPQAAMNALNPTRRIINFIEDVILAHDPTEKQEVHLRPGQGELRDSGAAGRSAAKISG